MGDGDLSINGMFGGSSEAFPALNLFEDGVSIQAPSKFDKDENAPSKTYMGDDTWKLLFPNGDQLKIAHGLVVQSIQSLANKRTIRHFTWSGQADSDEVHLTELEVRKGEYRYHHKRLADGTWQKKTWKKELGRWSEPEAEDRSFDFDNETYAYKFVDGADGIIHIIWPGGIEKAVTPEGITSEYVNGCISRITNGENERVVAWSGKGIRSLKDSVQKKVWTQTAEDVWTSDKGDKRLGGIIFKLDGSFGFRGQETSIIIDLNGREYVESNPGS